MKKERVAVLFGGRSVEHEISIITGLQAIEAFDSSQYEVVPVYVSPQGKWYTGDVLLDKAFYKQSDNFKKAQEILLIPNPTIKGLIPITKNKKLDFENPIPVDICFLAFHGQYGEDGCIQGLLEWAGLPYTGCSVVASAIAMDKYKCKIFVSAHGIPVLPGMTVSHQDALKDFSAVIQEILNNKELGTFPLFIKPNQLGSSIGIGMAKDVKTLQAALAKAFQFDDIVLIEPCVTEIMEINVSVLEGAPPRASVLEIPITSGGQALSYEDKYLRGSKKTGNCSGGMASLTRIIDPPQLEPIIKKQVEDYALKAFSHLQCGGVVRFDFILDKATNRLYFNELNPIPGSFAFYLWQKSHPPLLYTEVIQRMLKGATQRKAQKLSLQYDIGFKALK